MIVVDVGAQVGTGALYAAFPQAHHVMIEPVEENRQQLEALAARLKSVSIVIAASGGEAGTISLKVSPDTRYASVGNFKPEGWSEREVPIVTVDELVREARSVRAVGEILLKIDVDGMEPFVLEGAKKTLNEPGTVVVIETSFLTGSVSNFGRIYDIMRVAGYEIWDIIEPLYRARDSAQWQCDTVYVQRESPYRALHTWR